MRALVAGLALLALAPATPALAAPPRGTLTVTASGHAARVVTLTRAVTLDLKRVTVSGGGELSGFFLIPEAQEPAWAAATGAAFWREGSAVSVWRTSRTSVPAGRYRLHVTAPASVQFTVPVTGLTTTRWRPTGRLAVADHRATWTTAQGPLVLGAVTVPLTATSLVLMRLSYRATTYGEEVRACVGADGQQPGCTSEEGMYVRNEDRAGERDARGSFFVLVHAPAPGPHSARWQVTAYGVISDPEARALVVG